MTGTTPATPPGRDDLTPRVFRALYAGYDLHAIGGTHIAVPAGTPWYAGPSIAAIGRQISQYHPAPGPPGTRVVRPVVLWRDAVGLHVQGGAVLAVVQAEDGTIFGAGDSRGQAVAPRSQGPGNADNPGPGGRRPTPGRQQQSSPRHASRPSRTATAATASPATGSSHHVPNRLLPASPISTAAAR